jgi:hypothetical protein
MDIEYTVPTTLAISLSNRDSLVSSSAHFCQAVSGYESVSYAKLEYFAALSRQTETTTAAFCTNFCLQKRFYRVY